MSTSAHIFQINASSGGVPKHATFECEVGDVGLTTDRQAHPQFHGGPERALCLYSLERILELQNEGHPIYPGSTGENVTLSGVDWGKLGPGDRLRLGNDVEIEITDPATPCKQIAASFTGGEIERIAHVRNPGWSRLYARIISPGSIRIGDTVTVSG